MAAEQPLNRIHVSNLAWTIQEENLKDMFSEFGNVTVVKIPKRKKGGSKGFGFVTFDSEEAATKAVKEMNNVSVEDRRIGVVYSTSQEKKEKPAVEEGAENNKLHVRQLEWGANGVTDEDLRNEFSKYGTVKAASVKTTAKGASRGYGFVEFETVDEARAAKEGMDNMELKGRVIRVLFAKSTGRKTDRTPAKGKKGGKRKQRKKPAPEEKKSTATTTEQGEDSPAAPPKKQGGKKKGARKNKKGGRKGKKQVAREPAEEEEPATEEKPATPERPARKKRPRNKIYCKIPAETTSDNLQDFFGEFGAIKKIDIPKKRDEDGIKGHAFVTFEDEVSATTSIEALKATERTLLDMVIVAKFARPPYRRSRKQGKRQS